MPKQSKIKYKFTKNTIHFILWWPSAAGHGFLSVLFWSGGNIHRDTPLEKTEFFLSCEYHLQVSFWLRVEHSVYFSFFLLGSHLAWTHKSFVNAAKVCVSSYLQRFFLVRQILFPWRYSSHLDFIFAPPLLSIPPKGGILW